MPTARLLLIGHPVAGMKSPAMFAARVAERGLDLAVETVDVPPDRLAGFLHAAFADDRVIGLVSTAPHKQALASFADDLGPFARRIGLANALRRGADGRIEADMFDGHAFDGCIAAAGITLAGRTIGVIGYGAAGRACALAARGLGATRILACDIAAAAQKRIAVDGGEQWDPAHDAYPVDVLVNAGAEPINDRLVRRLQSLNAHNDLAVMDVVAHKPLRDVPIFMDGIQFASAQFDALWDFIFERQ